METQPPLHSGCVNWLTSENRLRNMALCFVVQVRLLFTWSRTFLLILIKWGCSSLPIYFISGNTISNWPMPQVHVSQSILMAGLALLSIIVTTVILPLQLNTALAAATWDPITSIASRFPNSVTAVPTVSKPSPQRRVISEFFKDAGGFPHKLISHGERYAFWTLPVWVSRF